jgi:hypothetical protein
MLTSTFGLLSKPVDPNVERKDKHILCQYSAQLD